MNNRYEGTHRDDSIKGARRAARRDFMPRWFGFYSTYQARHAKWVQS